MLLKSEKQYFFANLPSGYKKRISSVILAFWGLTQSYPCGGGPHMRVYSAIVQDMIDEAPGSKMAS